MKNAVQLLRRTVALLGLALSSAAANAASVSGPIAMLYPMADGTYVFGLNVSVPTCSTAGSIRYFFLTVGQNGVTADGARQIIATALMAFASDKSVTVGYNDGSTSCFVNTVTVP